MRGLFAWAATGLVALAAMLMAPAPAAAQAEAQLLVNRAAGAIERLKGDPNFQEHMLPRLERARAVLVVPELYKAGFILGGEYGAGVLLARRPEGGWSYPAFYTMGGGSLGLQIGVQSAEVVFMIMTEKGLDAVMSNSFKLGAGASVAFVAGGAGIGASTTSALGADIIAFSHTMGLFGGGSLEGAVIRPRGMWNAGYYAEPVTPEQILRAGTATNPGADKLREVLGG